MLLYSLSTKTCLIIELTCCCEENIEQWHQKKFLKYEALSTAMKLNGWEVHLFPVEVGARGFCGTSIKSCLSRLGFTGRSIKACMKSLSIASIKASFYIWQCRDSNSWKDPGTTSQQISKTFENSIKQKHPRKYETPNKTKSSGKTVTGNVGLINKGNTCYINSCIQCLNAMPEFWSNMSSLNDRTTPFVSSFLKIMSLLTCSKSPIDPSQFLRFLQQVLIKSGQPDFNLYQQQDAAEILLHILNELSAECLHASNLINTLVRSTITCHSCVTSSILRRIH